MFIPYKLSSDFVGFSHGGWMHSEPKLEKYKYSWQKRLKMLNLDGFKKLVS